MSKHLASHPAFIEAFVSECFINGFNEKQAADLLDTYAKAEFYKTDKDFREGVDSFFKSAQTVPAATWNLIKSMGRSVKSKPGIFGPALVGAAAGAFTPEGILPEDMQGGALTGATLGGVLGLLGNRRGLGNAFGRLTKAVHHGGVGRAALGEAGKLLTNKSVFKGLGKGALGGAAAAGTSQLMNKGLVGIIPGRYPGINPDAGTPWYMSQNAESSDSIQPHIMDPFALPPEIMAEMSGSANRSSGASGRAGVIQGHKQQLSQIENQINELQANLPHGFNPSSYAHRQAVQGQIDNLKMQRNVVLGHINSLDKQMREDKSHMFNTAMENQHLAERGLSSADTEFQNLYKRRQLENEGGILGGLMGAYNKMTGLNQRLSELDPIYSGYQHELERARKLQELANH